MFTLEASVIQPDEVVLSILDAVFGSHIASEPEQGIGLAYASRRYRTEAEREAAFDALMESAAFFERCAPYSNIVFHDCPGEEHGYGCHIVVMYEVRP